MSNPKPAAAHVLISLGDVRLVRYGPPLKAQTRYEVIEPDHVAGFSHLGHPRPLEAAVKFCLDRANRSLYAAIPCPPSYAQPPQSVNASHINEGSNHEQPNTHP